MAGLLVPDSHELTAVLAYQLWERRPFGSPQSGLVRGRKRLGLGTTRRETGSSPVGGHPGSQ